MQTLFTTALLTLSLSVPARPAAGPPAMHQPEPAALQDGADLNAVLDEIRAAIDRTDKAYSFQVRSATGVDGEGIEKSRMALRVTVGPRHGRRGILIARPFRAESAGPALRTSFNGQDLIQIAEADKLVRTKRFIGMPVNIFTDKGADLVDIPSALPIGLGGGFIGGQQNSKLTLEDRIEIDGRECDVILNVITAPPSELFDTQQITELRVAFDAKTRLPRRSEMRVLMVDGEETTEILKRVVEVVGEIEMTDFPERWDYPVPEGFQVEDVSADAPPPAYKIGDTAPGWGARTATGEVVQSADMAGRYVLLDFFATWYGPSADAVPELQALHEKHGKDGLVVIGASVHERRDADPTAYLRGLGATYTCLVNAGRLTRSFSVHAFPQRVFIGPDRKILGFDLDSVREFFKE